MTLIEVMISFTILGIIVAAFTPLFVLSAKNNDETGNMLDSTHLGKDIMEFVYNLSLSVPFEDLGEELVDNHGYTDLTGDSYGYEFENGKYAQLEFLESENLINVVLKIFNNIGMNRLEVQFETLYVWVGRGILSEE